MPFITKSVIITGATSGIGQATALRLAKLGANLTLVGRNTDKLKAVAANCAEVGKTPLTLEVELTNESQAGSVITETVQKYGKLDVLVNSAGIIETGSIENTSLSQLDRMLDINLRSVYNLTMQAVPHLIQTKGNIVNVSSVAGSRSFPNVLAYCVSKAAVDQLTRCTALELAPNGVRVNSVNPGLLVLLSLILYVSLK